MIQEFYYGASWHWPLDHIPRVMLSYNYIRHIRKPWKISIPFMLDSGAFSIILKEGRYIWDAKQYADAIAQWNPDVAWTMDYPCEPSVRAKGGYTPAEAQEYTNNNTIRLLDVGAPISNVLQGWTIQEYLRNLDAIRDAGLLTERLGIGSVCRRGKTNDVARIIRAIHREVPGWVKLHAFGVKTQVLNTDARYRLYSADSMSWAYSWHGWTRNERTKEKKIIGLHRYIDVIEPLLVSPATTLPVEMEIS